MSTPISNQANEASKPNSNHAPITSVGGLAFTQEEGEVIKNMSEKQFLEMRSREKGEQIKNHLDELGFGSFASSKEQSEDNRQWREKVVKAVDNVDKDGEGNKQKAGCCIML